MLLGERSMNSERLHSRIADLHRLPGIVDEQLFTGTVVRAIHRIQALDSTRDRVIGRPLLNQISM